MCNRGRGVQGVVMFYVVPHWPQWPQCAMEFRMGCVRRAQVSAGGTLSTVMCRVVNVKYHCSIHLLITLCFKFITSLW